MSAEKALGIRVFGKVQGVFFRAAAHERAQELLLRGFTRNEPDGSVYIEVEGLSNSVDQFTTWCHQGPPRARVIKVETEVLPKRGFSEFEIRR